MQISLCISIKFLKLKTKKEKEKEKKDLSTTTGHLSWKLLGKKKKSKLDIDLILKKKKIIGHKRSVLMRLPNVQNDTFEGERERAVSERARSHKPPSTHIVLSLKKNGVTQASAFQTIAYLIAFLLIQVFSLVHFFALKF